jgi:hypothetical protein
MNGKGVSLAALMAADQTEIEIMWPGGTEGTGWFLTIAGPGHEKSRALADAIGKRILRREAQIEAASFNGRKYKPPEVDIEERRRENVANVCARILGWRGLTDDAGAEIKFSEEQALKIFLDPAFGWAYNQVSDYLNDERSFTRRSATA